ncbi:T9SS type A sorting domain-containing protein [Flavobacterium sp. NST-5]|uniref:T9SS type A sorting domain-containing protein n=1 Tax=Flavobacterium ichthyis TaxID=2698827 RepID=A0ABW9ZB31_9FLAO|nr:T9SS type A sorting domain-containing protein [Flavobacterium ichthyis]NBL64003.1 T9SS type A sorting domain-containing protein [Flavobacterium ichthyis]
MKTKLFFLALLLSRFSFAQDGITDVTFGTSGRVNYSIFSSFISMKADYNNKIVALGRNTAGIPILVRFNTDGSLDTTFDTDGVKEIDFGNANESPASFCIFDNGTGWGYLVLSSMSGKVARILDNGSFAPGFGTNGILEYEVNNNFKFASVTYDWANYKILIVRANDVAFSNTGGKIYRLNPNGTFDTTFNGGNPKSFFFNPSQTVDLNNVSTDENGSIFIHGYKNFAGAYQSFVVKFSTTGAQDFGYVLQVSGSSSYTIPGFFLDDLSNTSYIFGMNTSNKFMVVKKLASGSLDNSFANNGILSLDYPNLYYDNVTSLNKHDYGTNDFKIILAGRSRPANGESEIVLSRLNSDGTLDTTFGTSGFASFQSTIVNHTSYVHSAIDYSTGKIYAMGYSSSGTVSLARYNLSSVLSLPTVKNNTLKIYPNPTTETLNFSEELKNISVIDITGRILKSFPGSYSKIDISQLSTGNYILKGLHQNGKEFHAKVVKN